MIIIHRSFYFGMGGKEVNIHLYLFMIEWHDNLPYTDQDNVPRLCLLSTETENSHGFFFFYALLSRDNDLLSG